MEQEIEMKLINDLKGASVQDVPADKFISEFATFLEKSGNFKIPVWADFVKTGTHKELAPYESNWLFVRAAAIARKLYLNPKGIGVGSLRAKFGNVQRNGTISSSHHRADGKIIRYCIKEMEKMKFVDMVVVQVEDETGKMSQLCTKGKKITKVGRSEMDKIAYQVYLKMHPRK